MMIDSRFYLFRISIFESTLIFNLFKRTVSYAKQLKKNKITKRNLKQILHWKVQATLLTHNYLLVFITLTRRTKKRKKQSGRNFFHVFYAMMIFISVLVFWCHSFPKLIGFCRFSFLLFVLLFLSVAKLPDYPIYYTRLPRLQ